MNRKMGHLNPSPPVDEEDKIEIHVEVGMTPAQSLWFMACEMSDFKLMELARSQGVGVDTLNEKGFTALWEACERKDAPVVKYLLEEGAAPNGPSPERAPLWAACGDGHAQVVELLIDAGADPAQADEKGWTFAHGMCAFRAEKCIEALIVRDKFLQNPDRDGFTPLDVLRHMAPTAQTARIEALWLSRHAGRCAPSATLRRM